MLHHQTSIQQKLPAQLEAKLTKFHNDTKVIWRQHKFPPELIINKDETLVCFATASNTTIYRQGKKEVIIRGTGADKCRFTATLTCTASSQMFQPFVTFKAITERILKKIKVKENDDVITTQANGWVDYELMMCSICKVLVKYTKGHHALLVFDTFKGHLKEEVLAKPTENNISYVIVPGGCMSKSSYWTFA